MRACLLAFLVLLVTSTTGCLDYREHLILKEDGSGSLQIDFLVDLGILNEISKALGEKPDPAATQGPTKDEVLNGLEVEGVEVKEIEIKQRETKSKVHLLINFKSLEALNKIEGFGDDRRVDFYDNGDGQVRVVYSFDTRDQLPMEEFGDPGVPEDQMDPIEKKIVTLTKGARDKIKFRSRVTLPGPIGKSTGIKDPREPKENERVWLIDKERDEKKHARLGKGKLRMQMIVAKSSVPWVKELKPLPTRRSGPTPPPDKRRPGPPDKPGGLGD
ncbi:MAG TPA: hypothetical protein DEA08_22625 [Planctomycetes bacterium]|nr:hypothetical protein [Planctomycetota bacterium]